MIRRRTTTMRIAAGRRWRRGDGAPRVATGFVRRFALRFARAGASVVAVRIEPARVRATSIRQRQRLPGDFFDGAKQGSFAVIAKRNRASGRAGAGCPSNPMHIGLGRIRQFVIHDMGHIVDIDPARGDIGRDKHARSSLAKIIERAQALALAFIAMDYIGAYPGAFEMLRNTIRAALRAREDDGAGDIGIIENFGQNGATIAIVNEQDLLRDPFRSGRDRGNGDLDRVFEQILRKRCDCLRHCRRKQKRLTFLRQACDNFTDRRDEPEIEHMIRLVEHKNFSRRRPEFAAGDMIKQATGRRHQHIKAAREHIDLGTMRDAADDNAHSGTHDGAIGAETVRDLRGELARRREDQCARCMGNGPLTRLDHAVENWQREGGGLARAGLGDPEQIATLHQGWDRLRLNGGRGVVTGAVQRLKENIGKAEIREVFQKNTLS